MRALKILTVAVAALILLMVFQNSFSQSLAISEAKETENARPSAEASSPEEPKSIVSDSGAIQSVPGPPLFSGSVTQPRAQFAITESVVIAALFVVLACVFFLFLPCLLGLLLPTALLAVLLAVPFDFLFLIPVVMVLPVLLASFADLSSYDLPAAVQAILNDIGSRGTVTEIAFAYLRNLYGIVSHLPEIARLAGGLDTGDYAQLIKRSGSFILDWPRNLRALPGKTLHALFPTVNALPAWLRQAPILLQVFPLQMYTMFVLALLGLAALGVALAVGMPVALALLLAALIILWPVLLILSLFVFTAAGFAISVFTGGALGVIGGVLGWLATALLIALCGMVVGASLGAIMGLAIFFIGITVSFVILFLGVVFAAFCVVSLGLALGAGVAIGVAALVIALVLAFLFFVCALAAAVALFLLVSLAFTLLGFVVGALCGLICLAGIPPGALCASVFFGAFAGLVSGILGFLAVFACLCLALPFASCIGLIASCIGVPISLLLIVVAALLLLLLMLPVGPQAVKAYPSVFRLGVSLAGNSLSICVGLAALPASALLSVLRGLPGSLRAVLVHTLDCFITPPIFLLRALPPISTLLILAVLWILGLVLALLFSPLILVAPVFIILALFAQGLIDREKDKDVKVLDTDEIKKSVNNLPENVGEVDRVIKRMAEMLGKAATTDISGLIDALLDVDWLIATQNLPYMLPEAMQAVGSAVPAIINSCPEIIQTLIDSMLKLTIGAFGSIPTTCTTMMKDCFAPVWAMPEFALLIPQLLEILSVLTINLPALIRGFVPAAVDSVEQTGKSLPELGPAIVLSTMGLNSIVLQFAKGVWDLSMKIAEIMEELLWSMILYLPRTVFDFDDCVTPWFGPRLLSIVGAVIAAIPACIIGVLSAFSSLMIAAFLEVGMCCYIPSMVCMQIASLLQELIKFCTTPITCCFDTIQSCMTLWTCPFDTLTTIMTTITCPFDTLTTIITCICFPFDLCDVCMGFVGAITGFLSAVLVVIPVVTTILSMLVSWIPELASIVTAVVDFINAISSTISAFLAWINPIITAIQGVINTLKALCYTPIDMTMKLFKTLCITPCQSLMNLYKALCITPCTTFIGLLNALILNPINTMVSMIQSFITACSLLTQWLLPIFFLILVVLALFPLVGIGVAFGLFAFIYFALYIFQIMIGTLLMAFSGVFDSVVCVPLISLFSGVPVIPTLLGYMRTCSSFYAFFIPPNWIEIVTQSIPLSVNLLAACPAITFMPVSFVRTFIETSSGAIEAVPSSLAYFGGLTDRVIFSCCAEFSGCLSLAIDVVVALALIIFSVSTSLCAQILSLKILTEAPAIAVLVLALIFVIFAWVIDLAGIICLRAPDMIDEYANSILKSMAMMPILSAIVPEMAGAPAQMRPEVVSRGISQLFIIVILIPCALCGGLCTLLYNVSKECTVWICMECLPASLRPWELCGRALDFINRTCSGVGSTLESAGNSIENQLTPYEG